MYRKKNMKLILILKVYVLKFSCSLMAYALSFYLLTGPKMFCASPKNLHTFCAKPNDDLYSVNLVFVLASIKFAARVLPSLNFRQFSAAPLKITIKNH